MKILIFGGTGQLGTELNKYLCHKGLDVVVSDRKTCDITSLCNVKEYILKNAPDVVVNCAAYTAVDDCEENSDEAYAVNAIGARNVAIGCKLIGSKLIHISTDFVFDGLTKKPYYEFDRPNPLSIYGKSKLAGEHFVRDQLSNFFIVRTSWLYGHFGDNFIRKMMRLAENRDEILVINDQFGTPTYVNDLVCTLEKLAYSDKYGVYHYSNEGQCSWFDYAKEIFELANINVDVVGISTSEFNSKATRPSYSVLENYMFRQEFNLVAPKWKASLKTFMEKEKLLEEY